MGRFDGKDKLLEALANGQPAEIAAAIRAEIVEGIEKSTNERVSRLSTPESAAKTCGPCQTCGGYYSNHLPHCARPEAT